MVKIQMNSLVTALKGELGRRQQTEALTVELAEKRKEVEVKEVARQSSSTQHQEWPPKTKLIAGVTPKQKTPRGTGSTFHLFQGKTFFFFFFLKATTTGLSCVSKERGRRLKRRRRRSDNRSDF